MKDFSKIDFNDRPGRIWFNSDKYTTSIIGALSVNIEYVSAGFTGYTAGVGSLSSDLECFTCSMSAHSEVSTGDLVATTECLSLGFYSGCFLQCQLEGLTFLGRSSMAIEASLPYLEVTFSSGNFESFSVDLLPITCYFEGDNQFIELTTIAEKVVCELYTGAGFVVSQTNFVCELLGIPGSSAELIGELRYFTADILSGNHIRTVLNNILAEFVGDSKVFVDLNGTLLPFTSHINGTAAVIATLNATLRSILSVYSGTSLARSSDDLEVNLNNLRAILSAHFSGYSEIEADIENFIITISGSQEINSDITASMEYIDVSMLSFNSNISCTQISTLMYGGR
jgi:hypothetical protein